MPEISIQISYCPKFRVTEVIPTKLLLVHAGMSSEA